MPSEIFYDTFDIEAETLDAVMPDLANGETNHIVSPFPALRKSGRRAILSLRTAVLANEYIHAVIGIDLGGRLLALHDKRTGVDILPLPKSLDLVEGGIRGVEWRHGLEVSLGESPRPTALGPMEHLAREPDDEDSPAELILHEVIAGTGLGLQLTWRLNPGVAELELDVRLLNRTMRPVPGRSGVLVHISRRVGDRVWFDEGRQAGLSLSFAPSTFDVFDDRGAQRRVTVGPLLEAHQLDAYRLQIQPLSGLPSVSSAGRKGAISVGSELVILAHEPIGDAKALLQLDSGQAMEAPARIVPGEPLAFDLTSVPGRVVGVVVRDAAKQDQMRWSESPDGVAESDSAVLETRLAGKRGAAHLKLAHRALAAKNWEEADHHLEEALLFNGDDPLTWWLKAVAQRLGGLAEGDRPELLNAHFLAPLEPALRAEAFLQQNVQSSEPSPLMAPLAKNPEAVMDVACLLIEAGLVEEASRFIDEALRHRELPMLRALLAGLLVAKSAMSVDAANHVAKFEQAEWEPPFPWRTVEEAALRSLVEAFPRSEKLKRAHEFASRFTTEPGSEPSFA